MLTAVQIFIVYISGSVTLLADTIHNFGGAATAITLWIAFSLIKRKLTKKYTYGYGKVEDLAGSDLSVSEGHSIANNVRRELLNKIVYLLGTTIHVDPSDESGEVYHSGI
ncbi:cation transporter [uncultured Methanolobus sp.]|uniref:cation transporter n=1 Tax=uncultured Methanolobus sp. TaxID=218300 RepID=UPI002AAAA11B|nr:cation transporter [uncultured Methanolobus sp.]